MMPQFEVRMKDEAVRDGAMADGKHCPACGRDIGYRSVIFATSPMHVVCPNCGARLAYAKSWRVILVCLIVSCIPVAATFYVGRLLTPAVGKVGRGYWLGGSFVFWGIVLELAATRFLRERKALYVRESVANGHSQPTAAPETDTPVERANQE
jgi:hypothetical protein